VATPCLTAAPTEGCAADRCWGRAEYLLWWVKSAPLPVPLVTTGDPNLGFDPQDPVNSLNIAGALGQPGTQVLAGGRDIGFPGLYGARLTVGCWVGEGETLAVEASGFVFGRRTNRFAVSDENGLPLYFPIFSEIAGDERGIPISDANRGFTGNAIVTSSVRLWGMELNGITPLTRGPGFAIDAILGARYVDLMEQLAISNSTTDVLFENRMLLNDAFSTRNQFYGTQVGAHVGVRSGGFSVDVTGKLGLGVTRQTVNVQGSITQFGPNPLDPPRLGTSPGGLFAQPSNMGRSHANRFTLLPAVEVKAGYAFDDRTRVFVGYDILGWGQVVRPGNQVDRHVNLTQNAVLDPNGTGTLIGPAAPTPLQTRSEFWAHGISVGLEFLF